MAGRYGPTRAEWRLRLLISLAGLCLLVAVLAVQGLPEGPGLVEVVGVAGLFFGLSAIRAARALRAGGDP
jgi:succinate-acetate transporter protein